MADDSSRERPDWHCYNAKDVSCSAYASEKSIRHEQLAEAHVVDERNRHEPVPDNLCAEEEEPRSERRPMSERDETLKCSAQRESGD